MIGLSAIRSLARRLLAGPALVALAAACLLPAAHAQTGTVSGLSVSSIPAGAPGLAGLQVYASTYYPASDFNVCFYTGYGSMTPIIPDSTQTSSGSIELTVDVPATTIQQIPPGAFAGTPASFSALVYLTTSSTACGATAPPNDGSFAVPVVFPSINNLSTTTVPAQNPDLSGRVPSNLNVSGANFLGAPIGSPAATVTSTVVFAAPDGSYTANGSTLYVSPTELRGSLPTNIPAATTSANVTVCNTAAGNSYCSQPFTLTLSASTANPGTLTANPSSPLANQGVTFTAQFGPATPAAVAGAPSGLVTFAEATNTFGTARLKLDSTAQFTQLPADVNQSTFNATSGITLQHLTADFNQDGVADSLFVDGAVSTFHIILGLPPFAVDNPFTVSQTTGCTSILSTVVGDFNGDGIPDLAFACTSSNGNLVYAMLGLGDGSSFGAPIQATVPNLPSPLLATGDFNKDGKADLVLGSSINNTLSFVVLTGDGTGNFTAGTAQSGGSLGVLNQLAASDLNGDGASDLLVGSGNGTYAFQNDGTGTFGNGLYLNSPFASIQVAPFAAGQLPSLIYVDTANGVVGFNQNTSTAAQISFADTSYTITVAGLRGAVTGDFNGDGLLDTAVAGSGGISVYVGNGTAAGFQSGNTYPGLADASATTSTLVGAVDENGDGYADLLTLSSTPTEGSTIYTETGYVTAGTASATLATQPSFQAGTHTITASTPGTYTLAPGTATDSFTITPTTVTPTILFSASPASPATYGTATVLTAEIDGSPTPTGTITFTDGQTSLGSAPLTSVSSGVTRATLTTGILGAATHTFGAAYAGDANYNPATATISNYVIQQATPSTSWTPNPSGIVYGTLLSGAQLDATSPVAGTFAYTPALGTKLGVGQQTLSAVFTPTDTTDYKSVTITTTITVTQATPAVSWTPNPSTIVFGTALSGAQLDATSPVAGTFAYTPAAGTALHAGTQTLTAVFTPTDTTDYRSVTTTTTITVTQATPPITWTPSPSTISYGTALSGAQLDASAPVTGTFAYTPAAGTVLTAGQQTLTVVFTPSDSTDYKTVTTTTTITVTQAASTVSWTPNPASIVYGTALSGAQLDATSTLPGTFAYTPAAGAVLSAGQQTLTVVFTPSDSKDYKPVTATTTITVAQATPAVSWTPNPSTITYGTGLSGAQLDASSPVAGSFAYSPAAGAVLSVGTQTLTAIFTPRDTTDYKPVTVTTTITVTPANTTITWNPTPTTIVYGTPLSSSQLDATSTVPGTFTYTPALGAVLAAGPQTLSALFTPNDTKNYKAVTVTAYITVTQATPAVTWAPTVSSLVYGTPLSGAQLNATSPVAGSFAYTPGTGTVLPAGQQVLTSVFTPADAKDYKSVTTSTTITITPAAAAITWTPNPGSIAYGTPLSGAQLDAQASVPGTFVYTPGAGTVLGAGQQTLSAVFTPSDTRDYKTVTVTAPLTVTSAGGSISWTPNPSTLSYGSPLSAAQLDATSTIAGTFAYTPGLGTVLGAGPQTLTTVFTPTDTKDYKTQTASTSITITQVTPAISWTPNPSTLSYGSPLSAAQLDATSPVAGTFTYTPALGTVLAAGPQTLTVVFTPTNSTDYTSATARTTVTVSPSGSTISWTPNPSTLVYGTALSAAQLDATSTIAGSFTYTPGLGTVLGAGQQTLTAVFTPTNTTDYKQVTTTTQLTVTRANPTLAWAAPASLVAGTPLSQTQLNATATGVTGAALPGSFVYTPAAGTLLSAGQHQLSVTFTPTDATDYSSVTSTVPITIVGVNLTSITPSTAVLGAASTTVTLTGTGFVANSVVLVNGQAIPTTYVSPTTLTAVVPASDFQTVQALQITVQDPAQQQTTNAVSLTVGAPKLAVVLSGPPTTTPGDQPQLTFQLTSPYPVALTGTMVL
ncbi:MAG TPA: FG-GAP-like repeat-containing protein, partial [Acidobacteriaceae bacterium]